MFLPIDKIYPQIIEAFEKPGPRYTSYPTAPVWEDKFDLQSYEESLGKDIEANSPLSLYLHLPFCEKLCHFCACNKVIDPMREHSSRYLEALQSEIRLLSELSHGRGVLEQMHWGGGTPTFYSPEELEQLFRFLEKFFVWGKNPEISVELNPVVTTEAHLDSLGRLGFNRMSMGVQDFDGRVQEVINRHQTFEQTKKLIDYARHLNFKSINLDLVYGLPLQTKSTISQTIEKVLRLRPERIALYSYANVPWKYPFQRRFSEKDLPVGFEKISLYISARKQLEEAGYFSIGMDHFALSQDELFKARKERKLHRNFMGYTTHGNAQMIAAGLSAISMMDRVYVQNLKKLPAYYGALKAGRLPVERGLKLSQDDRIRKRIIMDLMCNFELDFSLYENIFEINFAQYFQTELLMLSELEGKDLLVKTAQGISVTPLGQLLIRNLAMVFDRYLENSNAQFSKTI